MNSRFFPAWVCMLALVAGLATGVLELTGRVVCQDRNHDGVADVWFYYDSRGALEAVLSDTNFDGTVDAREGFENDLLVTRELDQDFDNRFDRVEDFGGDQPPRIIVDTDSDGAADLLVLSDDRGQTVSLRSAGVPPPLRRERSTRSLPAPLFDPFSKTPSFGTRAQTTADLTFTLDAHPHLLPQDALIERERIERLVLTPLNAPVAGTIARNTTDRAPPSSIVL